jgi:hypothetical protein
VQTVGASVEDLIEIRNGDRLMVEGFRMKEVESKYFGEGFGGCLVHVPSSDHDHPVLCR